MAFTRNWDEANPTDSTYATQIDDYNKYLRVDVSDRLKNMIYGFIAGENTYAQHFQYLDFRQQSSSPGQPAADFLRLYVKAVSNVSELFWRDDVNSERQLTSGGTLKVIAGDYAADSIDEDDIEIGKSKFLQGSNDAEDNSIDLIGPGANDLPTLPDSAEMASNAAPVEDEAIANKKYVDDSQKPTGRLHLASEQSNLTNNTWTKVALETISTGFSDAIEDTTNNKITPAVAGYYLVIGSVKFTNIVADKAYQTKIYKNGDTDICQSMVHAALLGSVTALLSDVMYLDADDYVQLYAFSGSGDNTVDISEGSIHTYLTLQRLR